MTADEIARVEASIGRVLPSDLRELYEQYPFASDSWAAEFAMPDSADFLISLNTTDSVASDFGLDPSEVLQIGTDGGESLYFAFLTGTETSILEAQLETGNVAPHDPDLFSWVLHLNSAQDKIAQEAERIHGRRWWHFWKG